MAVTYEWDVQSIDVIEEHGDQEHVICRVVWKCTATSGDKTREIIGVQELNVDNLSPDFVPFDQVTKEQILEWTKVWLNVPAIEKSLIPNTYTKSFLPDPAPTTTPTTSDPIIVEEFTPGDPGQ